MTSEVVQETQEEMPCIGCMECVNVCPAYLLPQTLFAHAKERELEQAQSYGIFDCIECGCCAYVCPSHIPLVDYYRAAKSRIWKIEEQRQKAEHARRRYEFREGRRQRQETERADRLREREKALDTDGPKDAIADAVKRSRQHRARRHHKDKD
jgi:electron transport complex protein RnfC